MSSSSPPIFENLHVETELADELSAFDYVYLLDVYSASESIIEGGTGKDLFECLSDRTKHCQYVYDREELSNMLSREVRDGEKVNIVFLGAGETNILAGEFAESLKARDPLGWLLKPWVSGITEYGFEAKRTASDENYVASRRSG